MREAREVVEKFVMPWLAEHHPKADIVIMAGSFGRAMKHADWQPIASSDIDLVIIYSDLEKGGFKAATQVFTQEDVGSVLGDDSRIMMIDTNIHDFASLHYHDKIVREQTNFAFMNVMLDEGYVLIDKNGVAPVLQEKAARFLEAGPAPTPQPRWQSEISRLETYLKDIRAAETTEEKRFLGTMVLHHVCEYVLGVHQYWRSGSNQAYRRLSKHFPEDSAKITAAFTDLLRHGVPGSVETLLEDYIAKGKALLPKLPEKGYTVPYPVDQNVPREEADSMRDLFLKFMTDHLCEALETSNRRGELANLENLSATVLFTKMIAETKTGGVPQNGRAGMLYLADTVPDLMPVTLQALDEGLYDPLRKVADGVLSHMGGLHYTSLQNHYVDDVARVSAMDKKTGTPAPRKWFSPGFSP